MNYEKAYYDYIDYVKTLNRDRNDEEFYELHHIVPKSMGGNNSEDNLVLLTFREHYLAHYLLWKIYGNKKVAFSFWMMNFDSNRRKISGFKINSRLYKKIREEFIEINSKKVICLETAEIFNSQKEASIKNNLCDGWSIRLSIRFKNKTANGYHWEDYNEEKDYTKTEYYLKPHRKYKNRLIRLEDCKIYNTIYDASCDNGVSRSSLFSAIDKKNRTSNGYHWEKYDEEKDYTKTKHYGESQTFNSNYKKVVCLETAEIFESQQEAARRYNIKISGDIRKSCENKKRTIGGYHWEDYDEYKDYTKTEYYGKKKKKGRAVICLETGNIYEKLKDVEKDFNINASSLTSHLNGKQKTFAGYHWEDYNEN